MIVFRLSKRKYAYDLSGKGAELAGGRWNSKGVAILYASQSRALCTAEISVHTPLGNIPRDYELVEILIPSETKIQEIATSELPTDWKSIPHSHTTQELGNNFIHENKHLVLKVPSVIVPGEFNYLINPSHRLYRQLEIVSVVPFEFDQRLFIR